MTRTDMIGHVLIWYDTSDRYDTYWYDKTRTDMIDTYWYNVTRTDTYDTYWYDMTRLIGMTRTDMIGHVLIW